MHRPDVAPLTGSALATVTIAASARVADAEARPPASAVVGRRRGGLALVRRDEPERAAPPLELATTAARVWEEDGLRILLHEPGLHWSGTLRPSDRRPSLVAVDTRGVHTVYIHEAGGDWRALVRRAAARLVEDDPATAPYIYANERRRE